jgi:hypothetical protein
MSNDDARSYRAFCKVGHLTEVVTLSFRIDNLPHKFIDRSLRLPPVSAH